MNKDLDQMLYDSLRPTDEPDPELNRRILDRRLKGNMRKWNIKKSVAAAAVGILVMAGGVSVYAETQNSSLLSLFSSESREIKDEAARLLDRNVTQDQRSDEEQSKWVSFEIREAIIDKNKVFIQVAAKPTDPDKYLLVPGNGSTLDDPITDLEIPGLRSNPRIEKKYPTIAEYAKSKGKQCVTVGLGVGVDVTEASKMPSEYYTESDGTLVLIIKFNNEQKTKNLNYVCRTYVYPEEENTSSKGEIISYDGEINFTLTDKSDGEVVKYVPVSDGTVRGTKLVVDAVTFEKSNLETMCKVEYHYPGEIDKMYETKDAYICFLILDSDGNIVESSDHSYGIEDITWDEKDGITKLMQYGKCYLQDLPETITFQAKDESGEKEHCGTVVVKRAE